jgi:mannosyltransferase
MRGTAWHTAAVLGAIVALGLYLRVYHLGDRPIWFDEAFSYTLIHDFSWRQMVERTAADVHPPFYYAVLRCWVGCFGTSPVAMRSLSVVLAGATIALFYFLCRDAFCSVAPPAGEHSSRLARRTGLISALLIAVSAAHIQWSYETRMYTLATALLALSTWALVRALRSPQRTAAWWTCYSLSAAALLYTHNYGLFSVAAQWLYLAGHFACHNHGWRGMLADRRFRQAAVAVACAAALYVPWLPALEAQKSRVQADYWIPAVDAWSVPEAWLSLLWPTNRSRAGTHLQAAAAAAALVGVVMLTMWHGSEGRSLLACMIICPIAMAVIVSLMSVSIVVGRHFLLAYMFVLCAIARLAAALPRPERVVVVGLLLLNSVGALARHRNSLRTDAAPGIRGAVEYVLEHRRADEPIVVMHPCIYFSARYYVGEQALTRLYLDGRQPLHYTGGPILRAQDCWNREYLDNLGPSRIWVLDTTGFGTGFRQSTLSSLPSDWRLVGRSESFRGVNFFEGVVRAARQERAAAPAEVASGAPGREGVP